MPFLRTLPRALLLALTSSSLVGCGASPGDDPAAGAPVVTVMDAPAPTGNLPTASVVTTPPVVPDPALATVDSPDTAVAFEQLKMTEGGHIVRWAATEVSVGWSGAPTATDLVVLGEALQAAGSVPGVPRLFDAGNDVTADVVFHFVPKSEWGSVLGGGGPFDDADGMTRYRFEGPLRSLDVAVVALDLASSQLQRNRTITHELLHALGLGHHRCPTASLYEGSDYAPDWRYNDFDVVLLERWYANDPGASSSTGALPCPEREWEAVSFEGRALWCGTDDRCYPVDERTGVTTGGEVFYRQGDLLARYDPDRFVEVRFQDDLLLCERVSTGFAGCVLSPADEVVDPVFWFDGVTVFDADPQRFTVFTYEGRRLLCEIPPADRRGACQFTDGRDLTGVDAYTDGSRIFDRP